MNWFRRFGEWGQTNHRKFVAVQAVCFGLLSVSNWLNGNRTMGLFFLAISGLHCWFAYRGPAAMEWLAGPMAEWDDPIDLEPTPIPAAPTPRAASEPWQDPGRPLSCAELRNRRLAPLEHETPASRSPLGAGPPLPHRSQDASTST
jgi:hypothetical protein